ncbi:DUF6448 family protein [bacterium]|nr:DUF6448 family protein [bacterium]
MRTPSITIILLALALFTAPAVRAHCDSLDGPVVTDARRALAAGEVTPVLRWVVSDDESAIRDAFDRTRQVRSLGPEARALADLYFFETLVRIHRQSEGAPYTGLKSEEPVEPGIAIADAAVESGSVSDLVSAVTKHAREGIHQHFERLQIAKGRADDSVEAGREFVGAYVEFIHYVKGVHEALASTGHQVSPRPHHD